MGSWKLSLRIFGRALAMFSSRRVDLFARAYETQKTLLVYQSAADSKFILFQLAV